MLAGDHCKEASDLGVPLIGVGFMYPQGYFRQGLTADGWQQENYETLDWADAPVEPALTPDGKPCVTAVPLGNRTVLVAVWRVRVGRVKLYLLDTNLEENAPVGPRAVGAPLRRRPRDARAAGDHPRHRRRPRAQGDRARIRRSITSTRATPRSSCCSASATSASRAGASTTRSQEVRRTTVFTTHTPVAAGHDAFPFHLVEAHLTGAWGDLGGYRERFLALGHYDNGGGPLFNMTALALRTSGAVNGVSQLHGEVTRQMWRPIWPELTPDAAAGARHHQRRPRPDLDLGGDRCRCSTATSAPTGSTAMTIRRSPNR